MNDSISLNDVIRARDKLAHIIAKSRKRRYLSIFERLEKEIELRLKEEALLQRALQIGTHNGTQNGTLFRENKILCYTNGVKTNT